MSDDVFSAEEKAATKTAADERQAAAAAAKKGGTRAEKAAAKKAAELQATLDAISAMDDGERQLAELVHRIVMASEAGFSAKTWYGFPAYHLEGPVVLFFQPASKFKARYSTLGFNGDAKLDDGPMWPVAFAMNEMDESLEERVRELVARAAG